MCQVESVHKYWHVIAQLLHIIFKQKKAHRVLKFKSANRENYFNSIQTFPRLTHFCAIMFAPVLFIKTILTLTKKLKMYDYS